MMRMKAAFVVAPMVLGLTIVLAGCGDRQTMASKSDRALREAQQKGLPIGEGGEHGGHGAGNGAMPMAAEAQAGAPAAAEPVQPMSGMAGMHHDSKPGPSSMPETEGHAMPGMSHGPASAGQPPMPAMPNMSGHSMPGMSHGPAPGASQAPTSAMPNMAGHSMPGMSHGEPAGSVPKPAGHAMHGMATPSAGSAPVAAPLQGSGVELVLRADPLDAPAAVSVLEAQRSVEIGASMSGMAGMHAGSYHQLDAGRSPDPSPPPPEHQHQEPR